MDKIIHFSKAKFSIDQFGNISVVIPPSDTNSETVVLKLSFLELYKLSMRALKNALKSNENMLEKLHVPPAAVERIDNAMLGQEIPVRKETPKNASKPKKTPTKRVKRDRSVLVKNVLDFVNQYVKNANKPVVFPLGEFKSLPQGDKLTLIEINRILQEDGHYEVRIDRRGKEVVVVGKLSSKGDNEKA